MQSWLIIAALLATLGGGAFYYYTSTQSAIRHLVADNSTLEANAVTLINSNQVNLDAISNLEEIYSQIQQDYSQLETEFQVIRLQSSELRERLGRHDLGALAAAKPALVERSINSASNNVLRCFELVSGSPLNEKERNASNEKEFNSECPWLFPGP
jgi:regulator of replication initiation timing